MLHGSLRWNLPLEAAAGDGYQLAESPDRLYAAELQAGQSDARRMSLAEVQNAASEAGIDKALVVQAARELSAPRPTPSPAAEGWLGAPRRARIERVVAGVMSEHEITNLFVVDEAAGGGVPVGILHMHDCLKAGVV